MLYIACWIILCLRPDYRVLYGFAGIIGAIGVIAAVLNPPPLGLASGLGAVAGSVTILVAVGACLIELRKWMKNRGGSSKRNRDIDAELAAIRAEAAVRESKPDQR